MKTIADVLQSVRIGKETIVQNLMLFPLLRERSGEPDYLTLDEALAEGRARITEVSASGSVPELRFANDGDRPVLLLDGEELIGAKQNRVLNLTILAPAHHTFTVPVSCVEAGRWSHTSAAFAAAPRAQYAEGRARKMAHVTEMLVETEGRSRQSNQGEVWRHIHEKSARMAVHSDTQAMAEIYEQHGGSVEEYAGGIAAEADQVGAIFAINGRVVGLELFDYDISLRKLLPKLVRSYALDAIDKRQEKMIAPSLWSVEALLRDTATAQTERFHAVGLGEDLRLASAGLTGAALLAGERIVHLSAFRNAAN